METTNRPAVKPEYRRIIGRLRNLCDLWRDDIVFVQNGGTIYFAVDVDVIAMYLNPKGKAHYGEVLRSKSQTGQLVARLIGDSIFHSNQLPAKQGSNSLNVLFLIPPHDQELLYLLWGIGKRVEASSRVSDATFQVLDAIVDRYSRECAVATTDRVDAVNNFLQRLMDHVPQLVAFFDEAEGDAAALKRFSRVDPARLQNIFNLKREDGKYFILQTEETFRNEISVLVSDWEARLAPHASKKQPREALAADARVLATIQRINTTVCSPRRERLVLISGSEYLFNALATQDVSNLSIAEIAFRKDFLLQYLRHPQWILSNRNFFQATQEEEPTAARVDEVGSGLRRRPIGLERLLELMAPLDDGNPSSVRQDDRDRAAGFARVQGSWDAEIKALAATKYGSGLDKAEKAGAINLARLISELKNAGKWSEGNFRKELVDIANQRMDTLSLDSSSLGLLDVLAEPSRMLPALCFDPQYEEYNVLYKDLLPKMIGGPRPGNLRGSSELRKLIEEVNRGSDGKNRDPYHVRILHAAAFAARGHWRQVLTLCDNAIQIANGLLEEAQAKSPDDEKKEYRKGREAAYLAAIARRRSARDPRDLERAQDYLDLAEARENVGDPPDLRFESESLAISNRRIYFNYFDHFRSKKPMSDEEKEVVRQQAQMNAASLLSIIDRARTARDSAESRSKGHDVADWVLRQCFTNLFDLALIRSDLESISIQQLELDQLFSEFKSSIKQEDELRDHHAWILSKVVWVLFNSNEPGADVLEEISKYKVADKPMPYETERFELYEKLIKEKCKK